VSPYVALGDLLEGAVEDVLPVSPAPRRRALELALRAATGAARRSMRARSASPPAARSSCCATKGPCCVAIDDVQWLDDPPPACSRSRCAGYGTRASCCS
jgi:hypothetical protein